MKKTIVLLMIALLCCALFAGCKPNANADAPEETQGKEEQNVDYSNFAFTGDSWTRDAENDIETIRFGADGSFSYWCACGNPVNDSDMCEGYTYDDETKTITLDCFETTEEMVTVIKIIKCDDNELQLDFDGDVRVFTRE